MTVKVVTPAVFTSRPNRRILQAMLRAVILFLLPLFSALGAAPAFQVSRLDHDILHVQTSAVDQAFSAQLAASAPTNPVAGTVLDLRFADGSSAAATNYFAETKTPLVILVNGETRGAAATLATTLRAERKAILIGSTNPPGAVTPDIAVNVSPQAERAFQKNPYAQPAADQDTAPVATNYFLPFIDHTSEADLVRQRIKDGENLDAPRPPPARPSHPPRVIQDPELARAVDLLKALAALRLARG